MMQVVKKVCWAAVVWLAGLTAGPGCVGPDLGESGQPIINGQLDAGHRAAVKLYAFDPGLQQVEYCTGTLVASMTIVTAGHCVFMASGQRYPSLTIEGEMRYFDPEFPKSWYYDEFAMTSASIASHPSYDPVLRTGTDLAIVRLPSPVIGVTPAKIGGAPAVGGAITIVGFGATSGSPPYPGYGDLKHWGGNTIDSVDATHLRYSGVTGGEAGPCFGDSGGPTFEGGYTSNCLMAVTRGGSSGCTGQVNFAVRVDNGVEANAWIRSQTPQVIGGC